MDPERFPDEREEMNTVGMGAVYTRTSADDALRDGSVDEISGLVDRLFTPYAQAFADLVDQRLAAVGQVTIVDLHSFPLYALPYELHGGPRPEICLGTDPFHTPELLRDTTAEAFAEFDVGVNSPFDGCYVPLTHYGTHPNVQALMVELRRDLYLDDCFNLVEPAMAPIVSALTELIGTIDAPVPVPITTCRGMFSITSTT